MSEPRARAHTREELLLEVEEYQRMAVEAVRVYTNGKGEAHEVPQPDFKAAMHGTELKAKLLGLLGDGKNLSMPQLQREVEALGWKLVPAQKPKGVAK